MFGTVDLSMPKLKIFINLTRNLQQILTVKDRVNINVPSDAVIQLMGAMNNFIGINLNTVVIFLLHQTRLESSNHVRIH